VVPSVEVDGWHCLQTAVELRWSLNLSLLVCNCSCMVLCSTAANRARCGQKAGQDHVSKQSGKSTLSLSIAELSPVVMGRSIDERNTERSDSGARCRNLTIPNRSFMLF
jgi:hypothetical protein